MIILTRPYMIVALLGLFLLAAMVGGSSNGLEQSLMHALAQLRADQPDLTAKMVGITNLGGAYVTLGVAAGASLWLLLLRKPSRALLLALAVLFERALVEGVKGWIGRPRPNFGVDWLPPSLAYPSGHSANSMTAFLVTALILALPAQRGLWATGAIILSILVGLSRIYLGVHWPTDVIGGWAFGLMAVGITLKIADKSRVLPFEPKHEVVGRHRPALGKDEAA